MSFLSLISKREVCLCLSGGGALGFAHIGAIKALEENEIFPTKISGTSMGAVIGAFYAAGYSTDKMIDIIKAERLHKITSVFSLNLNMRKNGIAKNDVLRKLICKLIPHNSFDKLDKKLFVCVSDMTNTQYKIIDSGKELDKWVAASSCLPTIFEPIKDNKSWYLDGGVLNNFPAQCFEKNYRQTIGINVIPNLNKKKTFPNKTLDIAFAAIRTGEHINSKEGREKCRFLIEPNAILSYNEFSFDSYEQIIEIGYKETIEYIRKNPKILRLSRNKQEKKKSNGRACR